jgi:hypothetical protein
MGYKNMCYFWSIDFLDYLKNYEYIIRIDEDCNVKHIDKNIFNNYEKNNIMFASGSSQYKDNPDVIVGMEQLFQEFIKEENITAYKKIDDINCPYTNIMIVNVKYFNENNIVQKILNKISNSNCIFSNRWGDLPIWGYILSLLIEPKYYNLNDKNIKYIHGSHAASINI